MAEQSFHVLDAVDNDGWDRRAADVLAAGIQDAVNRRGSCTFAISGGSSPRRVFEVLGRRDLPWESVTILQVDERIAPISSGERNLAPQELALGSTGARWLPLPVGDLVDVDWSQPGARATAAAVLESFAVELIELAGEPPVLDVVHLGLGVDGHTASLFPGDSLSQELRSYVGLAEPTDRTRRLSLTRACLDRARMVVWLVSGSEKTAMLQRLIAADPSIPAGLVRPSHSVIVADQSAVGGEAD